MPRYKLAARAEAERLDAEADVYAARARRNVQRALNYVLGVVLFASAPFFARIGLDRDFAGQRDHLSRPGRIGRRQGAL